MWWFLCEMLISLLISQGLISSVLLCRRNPFQREDMDFHSGPTDLGPLSQGRFIHEIVC